MLYYEKYAALSDYTLCACVRVHTRVHERQLTLPCYRGNVEHNEFPSGEGQVKVVSTLALPEASKSS